MERSTITDDPVAVATGRVALWRALVLVPLLALAFRWFTPRGPGGLVLPLLGACLGLVAAALTYPEALARRGRRLAGVTWMFAVAMLGVLWAAGQATYADRALAVGPTAALGQVHAATWLALYDPLTLPIVAAWGGTLALAALTRLPLRPTALRVAWPVLAFVGAMSLAGRGAFGDAWADVVVTEVLPPGTPRFALPSGIEHVAHVSYRPTIDVRLEVLVVTGVIAILTPPALAAADALRRRLAAPIAAREVPPPRPWAGVFVAVSSLLVFAFGLRALGAAPPFTSHVRWLLVDVAQHAPGPVNRVLARVDPEDDAAVNELMAIVRRPYGANQLPGFTRWSAALDGRSHALEVLANIGAARASVIELMARSITDVNPFVAHAARAGLEALGPRAHAAGPTVLVAELLDQGGAGFSVRRGLRRVQDAIGFVPTTADLLPWCEDANDHVAAHAMRRLAELPSIDVEALPVIERCVAGDEWPLGRAGAAGVAFGRTGEPGLALLRDRLGRPEAGLDPLLRVLRDLPRTPAALESLELATRHGDWRARRAGIEALLVTPGRDAWPGGEGLLFELFDAQVDPADVDFAIASYGARSTAGLVERLRDPARRQRALATSSRRMLIPDVAGACSA